MFARSPDGIPVSDGNLSLPYPPTIIVVHRKERRSKCTMEPLRNRRDLKFLWFPPDPMPDLAGYVRLSIEGQALSPSDAGSGLLLLDGTWKLTQAMNEYFKDIPARSISGFQTAYPRSSKLFEDPAGGLASVEALYVAHRILQRPVAGMLDGYRWAERFRAANGFQV